MPRRTDIWRVGIIPATIEEIYRSGLHGLDIQWLEPGPPFTFLADPFGLWRGGLLHLFVEAFDYRDRHGRIDVLRFDEALRLIDRRPCLEEPWHLSYPQIFEAEGTLWMLPEAHRSGSLRLYRCIEFPWRWEAATEIRLDVVPVDATVLNHENRWWLFYTAATDRHSKIAALHIAHADRLAGPWRPHPANPVRTDAASSRPGGTPFRIDEHWVLPVQDCSRTYGEALRMLRLDELTPCGFQASAGKRLVPLPSFAPFDDGIHTLSACGPVTLVDAKRIVRHPAGLLIDARLKLGRLFKKPPSAQ